MKEAEICGLEQRGDADPNTKIDIITDTNVHQTLVYQY